LAPDEKDLPASQSSTQTDPRVHGAHGNPRRTQSTKTPARQGTQTPEHLDPAQTARVAGRRSLQSFSKTSRLHRSAEFLRLQRKGIRTQSKHFVLYAGTLGDEAGRRLGITVSRRIGNAIVRNRLKRRIRECFRMQMQKAMPEGIATVIVALSGAGQLDTPAINHELGAATLSVLKRLEARDERP
jgi:ribonuclease P protein component